MKVFDQSMPISTICLGNLQGSWPNVSVLVERRRRMSLQGKEMEEELSDVQRVHIFANSIVQTS